MGPLAIAGLGLGLVGGVANFFGNRKANRRLEQLLKQNPQYKANPLAAQQMGLAQTLLNARMPGAAAAERNIYQNQANSMANVNRNATDASQALAMGASMQGQTNQDFINLAGAEQQDYQRRSGNLATAQQGVINEEDKVHQDQVRRFQDMAQIRGAQNANTQNSWSSLSNLGMGMMNLGLASGINGAGKTATPAASPPAYNDGLNWMTPTQNKIPLAKYPSNINTSIINPPITNYYGR
jgi:hypothetical protein